MNRVLDDDERIHEFAELRRKLSARLHLAGLDYWASLKRISDLPARSEFDPAHIPLLLPHLIFLRVTLDPLDYCYRVIGGTVREHLLANYTGRWISEIAHQRPPSRLHANLTRAVTERAPVLSDTPYVGTKKDFLKSDELILPLVDESDQVSHLLVLLDFDRRPLQVVGRWSSKRD
ncbi:MAG: PAS domain-containing protein [Nisaea sp.]|uniref:PAS domain-containing protein n=1 Tax=Nisaea sp. TaxID=2024842 RepID=UPI001B1DE874|nr:PAS domain-containing protein [Nisaea sp.]MBO6561599.1 PAS domain-containing protein [Nisaea sp.]